MKNRDLLPVGCLLALLACSNPFEPEDRLNGRVFDSKTNKPIAGANVYAQEIKSGILHNKQTDSLGYYSIGNLIFDSLAIQAYKPGYAGFSDTIYFARNTELNIGL